MLYKSIHKLVQVNLTPICTLLEELMDINRTIDKGKYLSSFFSASHHT